MPWQFLLVVVGLILAACGCCYFHHYLEQESTGSASTTQYQGYSFGMGLDVMLRILKATETVPILETGKIMDQHGSTHWFRGAGANCTKVKTSTERRTEPLELGKVLEPLGDHEFATALCAICLDASNPQTFRKLQCSSPALKNLLTKLFTCNTS